MNYKSQLKGWAVDRIIELQRANGEKLEPLGLQGLMEAADKLADYAYVAKEDLQSTAKDLFDLVRNAPANESMVDALLGTLEHIRTDRIQQGIDQDPDKVVELKKEKLQ